jgi:hypothetical protein
MLAMSMPATAGDSRDAARVRAKDSPATPIFVLNAAGFDRALASTEALLKMVERPHLSLVLRGMLAVSTNGLQGIDRERPFGLMTFINAGEVPEPVGVVYVPVTGGAEFLGSLKTLEYSVKPAADLAGGYRVSAGKQEFAVLIRGKYAFLARKPASLKRNFGDPAARFAGLSKEFDVCIRIQLDATPSGMKSMVLDYVRASAEMGFEIRRGETAAQQALRKAVGRAFLAGFAEAVRDGRSLTLGMKVAKSGASVEFEGRLVARNGSPLANGLNDLKAHGRRSSVVGPGTADFRIAANWKPPASLVPVVDAFAATLPKPAAGAAAWRRLRSGLFATGIRLVAWSAGGDSAQPATLAVLSFPTAQAAAAQVDSALAAFRDRGLVRTEKVAGTPKGPAEFQRVTSPAGTAAAAVAVLRSTAWIAVGSGKLMTLLRQEMQAAGGAASRKSPLKAEDLLHVTANWTTLTSLLRGEKRPASEPAPHTERFQLTVTQKSNSLILRAALPPTAIRAATAPVLKRLLPR